MLAAEHMALVGQQQQQAGGGPSHPYVIAAADRAAVVGQSSGGGGAIAGRRASAPPPGRKPGVQWAGQDTVSEAPATDGGGGGSGSRIPQPRRASGGSYAAMARRGPPGPEDKLTGGRREPRSNSRARGEVAKPARPTAKPSLGHGLLATSLVSALRRAMVGSHRRRSMRPCPSLHFHGVNWC